MHDCGATMRRMMESETSACPNTSTTMKASLLCCRKTGRVLFLETGEQFVDTLLSFLLLPLGTILHMLSKGPVKEKPLGGISCVFESVKNLGRSFLNEDKQALMEPRPAAVRTSLSTGLLDIANSLSSPIEIGLPKVYYRCANGACSKLSLKCGSDCDPGSSRCGYGNYTYSTPMTILPKDLEELKAKITVGVKDPVGEASGPSGQGFVKANFTYMVTDGLEIMPSTTIRSIRVLSELNVATLADLDSREVTVDTTQVLQLLHTSLTSTTCLNDVFGTDPFQSKVDASFRFGH